MQGYTVYIFTIHKIHVTVMSITDSFLYVVVHILYSEY